MMNENGDIIALLAAIVTASLIYYNLKKFSFWSSRGVKGPTPWPIFGTSIYYIFKHKIEVDFEWRKKYGRYYGVYVGYKPELRICDNELVKHIWIKEHSSFTDRNVQYLYHEVAQKWLLFTRGKHWSTQRALLTPVFTVSKIKTMFKKVTSCGQRFIAHADAKFASIDQKNVAIGKSDIMSLTLDSIAQSFFSLKLDTYANASSEFAKRAFAFATLKIKDLIFWVMTPSFVAKRLMYDLVSYSKYEFFDKLSMALIKDRRHNPNVEHNDILQAIIDAQLPEENTKIYTDEDDTDAHFNDQIKHDELSKLLKEQSQTAHFRSFSDLEMRGHMTIFFVAGFEPSANTLSWCFYVLAHNEAIQQEVYEELLTISKNFYEISYDDLMGLRKLNAFISEVLRIYGVVTELNRSVTAKQGVILPTNPPIRIPYSTAVIVSVLSIHRDPEYWPEPEKFDISRFYAGNKDSIKSCSYIPFGVGPRNCIGMKFALTQVKYFLAVTILNYRISYGPKSQAYPPKFGQHPFFLQLADADILLQKR